MYFASDNGSAAAPRIMDAVMRANAGTAASYGAEPMMERVTALVREVFEAPRAVVHLVATGTAANALALATLAPPWGAIFCHETAHVAVDECGAPEFFTGGARLVSIPGADGRITPGALQHAIDGVIEGDVHRVQRGALSLTNLTEAGTLYAPDDIGALTALAHEAGMPVHLDGARLANALVASGATPAEMVTRAGVDMLSLGGTKNGCLGVEAVVLFDPARAWEFELRRKRGGHLVSKHRFLSAQMAACLEDGLWLRLAAKANEEGQRLAAGLRNMPGVTIFHPPQANMIFVHWPAEVEARLRAGGAEFYGGPAVGAPPGDGRKVARLVTSWATTPEEVDRFLALALARG